MPWGRSLRWSFLVAYPIRALAAPAAVNLDYLFAVMTKTPEEYPSLQAVEAITLLAAPMLLARRGVLRGLR